MPERKRIKKKSTQQPKLFSALKTLNIVDSKKFNSVSITALAKKEAYSRVTERVKRTYLSIEKQRPLKLRDKIKKQPEIFKQARNMLTGITKKNIHENTKDFLKYWADVSTKTKTIKLVEGIIPGVKNRKYNENSWPTRFIIETAIDNSFKQLDSIIKKSFSVRANASLSDYGISIQTLFKKFKTKRYFVVTLRCSRRTTRGDAEKIAVYLKREGEFFSVQPERVNIRLQQFAGHVDSSKDVPQDTEWHLRKMNVFEAWQQVPSASGGQQGAGIVIGHPDSGWRSHPEYDELNPNQGRIDINRAHNVFHGTTGPDAAVHETAPQNKANNLTHGTATGSLMVSAPAGPGTTTVENVPQPGEGANANIEVTGIVPQAQVLPVKCITSVVLIGDTNVAHAMEYLITQNVDVISISLGGTPHHALEDIISEAVREHNIIVICAAGQINTIEDHETFFYHDTVMEPAAYQETIAVAATTVHDKPWADTFRGRNVDISAPGHNVWFADFKEDGTQQINYGSGTSFSAALVASIAALWLGFHGKRNLLQRYQGAGISLSSVFRQLIKETARRPRIIDRTPYGEIFDIDEPWNEELFGAGIIDAQALLNAPLPNGNDVQPPSEQESNFISWIQDAAEFSEEVLADIEGFGQDTLYQLEERARESEEFARNFITVVGFAARREAEKKAKETSDFLQSQWVFFEEIASSVTDALKDEAEKTAAGIADAWEEAEEIAEEVVDEIAETAEDAINAAIDLVEDADEKVKDGADKVSEWVGGWFK